MRNLFASACLLAGCLAVAPSALPAQEVIHALTGTISAINPAAKTITVFQDNGARAVFAEMVNHKTAIAFDKKIAAGTTAAADFDKQGAYAIIFYYGNIDDYTVVAVKGLGPGPFLAVSGTVTRIDAHAHTISVQDEKGEHTFHIDGSTIAEGGMGVVLGLKFQANSGDHVRVVASGAEGNVTALFLRVM